MSKPNERAATTSLGLGLSPHCPRRREFICGTTDGKRYIDGSGGSSVVTAIGHGVNEIPAVITKHTGGIMYFIRRMLFQMPSF